MDRLYINTRLRVCQDQIVHVKRHLPAAFNNIGLAVGQEVCPEDILGEGHAFSGFRTIHLASDLKENPQKALKYLLRKQGQNIYEGELLAAKRTFLGLKEKLLLSPVDGVIDFYDQKTGDLRIKLLSKTNKIASGVYGIIDHVDRIAGTITIKTRATLIYGVLGSGREREGILTILGSASDLIAARKFSSDLQGKLVVGGEILLSEVLEKAVGLSIAGIIAGGINAADFKSIAGGKWNFWVKPWTDIGVTILLTEGFGAIPLGDDVFASLREHNGRFAILDGNRRLLILPNQNQESMSSIRKTSLPIQLRPETEPETGPGELKKGSKVRVTSPPFLGMVGVVEAIDQSATKLPSGVITFIVTGAFLSRKIQIPYQNLEIIG